MEGENKYIQKMMSEWRLEKCTPLVAMTTNDTKETPRVRRQKYLDVSSVRGTAQLHGAGSARPGLCVKRGVKAKAERRGQTEAHHQIPQ